MDISAGIQASLAGRYASALFELASEAGTVTAVESDLETLGQALAESADLRSLTTNPQIGRGAQGAAIDAVAGVLGVSELTKKFLGALAANGRLAKAAGWDAAKLAEPNHVVYPVEDSHQLASAWGRGLIESRRVQGSEIVAGRRINQPPKAASCALLEAERAATELNG